MGLSPMGNVPINPQGLSPKGTVPSRKSQRGYLLVTVVITLFLVASLAVLLAHDSANSANTTNKELETARVDYVAAAGMQHALWLAQNNACMGDITIPATSLGADAYHAAFTGTAAGTFHTLAVDQDAWIDSGSTGTNKASDATLHIKGDAGDLEQPVYRFDLSSLPPGAQVNTAFAYFYVSKAHPEGPVTVQRITTAWTEGDVTWDSIGDDVESQILATIPAQPVADVWVRVNITAQAQAWMNGQPNYGIALTSHTPGVHGDYASREDGSNPPRLEVVVGSGPASTVAIQATGTLSNGNERVLHRPVSTAYQPPVTHVLRPGSAEGEDAEIWEQSPGTNYGDAADTWVSSASNDTTRSLLRFNLSGIPAGVRIINSSLSLYRESGAGADQPVSAHRITAPWSEASVTWNRRKPGVDWNTPGGDFESAAFATTPIGSAKQHYDWDVTPLVQGWIDGRYPNYGVILVAAAEGMPGEHFRTGDHNILEELPHLSVSYACACATACMAPSGSGRVAMVVDYNGFSLRPADERKKELLEAWGYDVDAHDDNFLWLANFNNYDVAYVSETVDPDAVGNKLNDLSIGVVNEDGWMNDELGFESADSSNWPVGKSINVTDTSHYITAPFVGGTLDIYDANMGGLGIGGTAAPGLQPLADWSTGIGLATLDTGAMTAGGTAASGRRVMLPFGQDTALNWSKVNNNGHLILKRSIDWAMGVGKTYSGKLLFVVGNEGSPAAKDTDRRNLFESWGYEVTLIDDGADELDYETELPMTDVIYVSGTAIANGYVPSLAISPTPLVNEESSLISDYGFSANEGGIVGHHTLTTSQRHYINDPYGGADVVAFQYNIALPALQGTTSGDLRSPGQVAGVSTVIGTIESGGRAWDGTPVPARRVQLPFENATVDQMTTDGQVLMRRSIEWAAGAGASSPSTQLLFVAADPTSLTGEESARIALIESWGYVVETVNDSDTQAALDSAASASDVVYVSEEIDHTQLGDKLRNTAKGIVVEEQFLFEEFGFSQSRSQKFHPDIDVIDNSHYITSEFSLGMLDIFTTDQMSSMVINPVADLDVLANLNNTGPSWDPSVAALDIGSVMYGGGAAPARRVKLPFISIAALNANGELLMRRAIEWAAGAGESGLTGPVAHWKLDEISGTTAVDSVGGNDGTLINGPSWVTGALDGGLSLDGSNDYIDVSSINPRNYDDFTISAWYKSADASVSDDEYIYMHAEGFITEGVTFGPTDDSGEAGKLRLTIDVSNVADQHYSTSDVVDQQWHHLVAVRSGGRIRLYVDNIKESDNADAHAGTSVAVDGEGPFIGDYPGGTEQVHGVLDDVRLYDRGLNDAEIAALFAGGSGSGDGGQGPSGAILLSTVTDATFGGATFGDDDLAEYDLNSDQATTHLDGSVFSRSDEDINAAHLLPDGTLILSTTGNASLGGLSFGDDDLVLYNPATDVATLLLDGSIFSASTEDIDAVYRLDSNRYLLSTDTDAQVGGLSVGDDDLFIYDANRSEATLYFDGALFSSSDEDINAVHVLSNGHLLLSTTGNATLGGLSFGDDDIVEYDPSTDTASLYLDGAVFSSTDEDIDAITQDD